MQCENCRKKPATVHLTELDHQNIKNEYHLCEECAQAKGVPYKVQFSFAELLSSLIEPIISKMMKEMSNIKCPSCGMNYMDLRKYARFGCAQDYEVFKKGIIPLLEKIHGSTQHLGKHPSQISQELIKEKEIRELQLQLENLIRAEEFEKAAEIRDKIKHLKAKKKKSTGTTQENDS